ncbi:MAG: oxygenase MpaB family protein, partial [Rhodospirillaceae bacterium]|nr:oxygenase MpaB family protein [Rhodospirillaceae bacterium]
AGIEQNEEALREAPAALRDFFNNLREPPWLYYEGFRPGVRVFHENVDLMLTAFVTGVLVEGFSTLIAKSFHITGRVAATRRRLRQNNRHMLEIFYPGGLQRSSEGWKLSTRIRFVHTRIRGLLAKSDEWDHKAWGTPLSAAHLGFAISVFSKRLLEYSSMLGARFEKEERESVLAVWRYAGYLMGIPETILYADAEEAERTHKVGYLCEPPPDADSVAVANLLIQSIPKVADVQDEVEQEKLVALAYRLSRALIGDKLADSFDYPPDPNFATLFKYRMQQRVLRLLRTNKMLRSDNFTQLIQISVFDGEGLSYRMPDHVHTSKSNPW